MSIKNSTVFDSSPKVLWPPRSRWPLCPHVPPFLFWRKAGRAPLRGPYFLLHDRKYGERACQRGGSNARPLFEISPTADLISGADLAWKRLRREASPLGMVPGAHLTGSAKLPALRSRRGTVFPGGIHKGGAHAHLVSLQGVSKGGNAKSPFGVSL